MKFLTKRDSSHIQSDSDHEKPTFQKFNIRPRGDIAKCPYDQHVYGSPIPWEWNDMQVNAFDSKVSAGEKLAAHSNIILEVSDHFPRICYTVSPNLNVRDMGIRIIETEIDKDEPGYPCPCFAISYYRRIPTDSSLLAQIRKLLYRQCWRTSTLCKILDGFPCTPRAGKLAQK